MHTARAHCTQQPDLSAAFIHYHIECKCHDQENDAPENDTDDHDRVDEAGKLLSHGADDRIGGQGLDAGDVMLDTDGHAVGGDVFVHLDQNRGYLVPSDV